jgi:hypothetical protein
VLLIHNTHDTHESNEIIMKDPVKMTDVSSNIKVT